MSKNNDVTKDYIVLVWITIDKMIIVVLNKGVLLHSCVSNQWDRTTGGLSRTEVSEWQTSTDGTHRRRTEVSKWQTKIDGTLHMLTQPHSLRKTGISKWQIKIDGKPAMISDSSDK